MSTRNRSLVEMILARLSFGQVPVDGSCWADPKREAQPAWHRVPDADWSPISVTLFRPFGHTQRKSA
jgi:hypothetical protein